jgi:hypothetical protein
MGRRVAPSESGWPCPLRNGRPDPAHRRCLRPSAHAQPQASGLRSLSPSILSSHVSSFQRVLAPWLATDFWVT